MGLKVWREYQGTFELVGAFTDGMLHDRTFSYNPSYLDKAHAHEIAVSLPLRKEPYDERSFGPFFSGMVPEGSARTELAQRFHIVSSNYLSLLEKLGDECIGALRFTASDKLENASYRALNGEDEELLEKSGPNFTAASMQESRLSLAGAQSKTGLYLDPSRDPAWAGIHDWLLPEGSAPSTHILKVASRDVEDLPVNEYACMEAARQCGVKVAESQFSRTLPRTFVSRRFDRAWPESPRTIDGRPVPLRLHQEDFCQALGWRDYLKYEIDPLDCYARVCGELIRRVSSDAMADTRAFARQVAFDYAIGNCDSHLKNHAFLYSASWESKRLAPAYDIVCTTILGYDHNLGMSIGDHRRIEDVDARDFELFAGDVRVVRRLFVKDCKVIVRELPRALHALKTQGGKLGKTSSTILANVQPRLTVLKDYCEK